MDELGLPMTFGKQGKTRAPPHELPPKPQPPASSSSSNNNGAPPRGEPGRRGSRGVVGGGKRHRGGRRGRGGGMGGRDRDANAEFGGEASNLAGEDAAPRTDFDLSQSQSAASVSQPQQQPQPIGGGIEIEAGGATERAVQAEGAEGQALEPGTPHRLAHEAHGVAAGDFNAGDKRPLLSSPSGSVYQLAGRDNGYGQPLGGGAGRRGRGRGDHRNRGDRQGQGQAAGGRGAPAHSHGSDQQPRGFFKESFCEDPWKDLLQRSARA